MSEASNGDTNLAPVKPAAQLPTVNGWGNAEFLAGVMSSLDLSRPEDKLTLMEAIQGDSLNANDAINTTFNIRHMVAHPVELVDKQTGEIKREIRTVLIDVEGSQVAFVSRGIFRSACWLAFAYGQPPWEGGMPVKVVQVQLGDGKRTFKLVPADVTGQRA